MLDFEEAAEILFRVEGHEAGIGIGRKGADLKPLNGEERLDKAAFGENPAIGNGAEKAALAIIGGDGLGVEGIDVGVLSILRVERENAGQAMTAVDVPVELSLRVGALIDADVIGVWKGRRADGVVAVVERLEKIEFATNQRAGKGKMRSEALDAVSAAVDPAETRDRIFEEPLPFITTAAGCDFDHAARETAVFSGERIGEDSHRFDSGRRKAKRGLTGEGIADGNIVEESCGLVGVASLDVDETIGTAENSGKQRKRFLEIVIQPDQRFEGGSRQDLCSPGTRGSVNAGRIGANCYRCGLLLQNKLKIDARRSACADRDLLSGRCKAGESNGEFILAGKYAHKRVLAEVIGDGGELPARNKIFEGDASVGPEDPDAIAIDREDDPGNAAGAGKR